MILRHRDVRIATLQNLQPVERQVGDGNQARIRIIANIANEMRPQ
jgi:hypothetical protein